MIDKEFDTSVFDRDKKRYSSDGEQPLAMISDPQEKHQASRPIRTSASGSFSPEQQWAEQKLRELAEAGPAIDFKRRLLSHKKFETGLQLREERENQEWEASKLQHRSKLLARVQNMFANFGKRFNLFSIPRVEPINVRENERKLYNLSDTLLDDGVKLDSFKSNEKLWREVQEKKEASVREYYERLANPRHQEALQQNWSRNTVRTDRNAPQANVPETPSTLTDSLRQMDRKSSSALQREIGITIENPSMEEYLLMQKIQGAQEMYKRVIDGDRPVWSSLFELKSQKQDGVSAYAWELLKDSGVNVAPLSLTIDRLSIKDKFDIKHRSEAVVERAKATVVAAHTQLEFSKLYSEQKGAELPTETLESFQTEGAHLYDSIIDCFKTGRKPGDTIEELEFKHAQLWSSESGFPWRNKLFVVLDLSFVGAVKLEELFTSKQIPEGSAQVACVLAFAAGLRLSYDTDKISQAVSDWLIAVNPQATELAPVSTDPSAEADRISSVPLYTKSEAPTDPGRQKGLGFFWRQKYLPPLNRIPLESDSLLTELQGYAFAEKYLHLEPMSERRLLAEGKLQRLQSTYTAVTDTLNQANKEVGAIIASLRNRLLSALQNQSLERQYPEVALYGQQGIDLGRWR